MLCPGPAFLLTCLTYILSKPVLTSSIMCAGKKSIHQTCLYADQDGYADVLADMASGYMLFPKAWYCLNEVSCYNLTSCKQAHIQQWS